MWATEMGRDFLGDKLPPDEVNLVREGRNYGWPICYGKNIHDTKFDKNTYIRNPCMEPFEAESFYDLPAHVAPLGLAFIPDSWPKEYAGDLLVAYHGSWNSSVPVGYKIARLQMNWGGSPSVTNADDFITGWLTSAKKILGRPVGIITHGDVIYISDDSAGVVYKVEYKK